MKPFSLGRDRNGRELPVVEQSDYLCALVFAGPGSQSIPIPSGATFAAFASTGAYWVRVGGSATVPAADVLDGTAAELNPPSRALGGATVLGVAVPLACTVSVAFYG